MWVPLVIKIVNVLLLLLFSFTLGSSLANLSFSSLLSSSIASLLSAILCWLALVAGAWALAVHLTKGGLKWKGLPWLILGAALGCAGFWLWNSLSGNASAVCSGISFLADVCGGKISQWVFMGLFIASVALQLLVWRYTANAIGGGDGNTLFHVAHARRSSSSSSAAVRKGRGWAFWRRRGRAPEGDEESDEEALQRMPAARKRGGGRDRDRDAWSEGSSSAGESAEEEEERGRAKKGASGGAGRYAPVGRAGVHTDSE
ncbi:hypothetical protein JCM10449v2_004784 [Rhodotorula kratochvilovae]